MGNNIARSVETFESIPSTNDLIKEALLEGAPEGHVARAFVQTAGYGRQGRDWASPFGGMYQSVLLRPQVDISQLPTLSLVISMAVRDAIVRVVAERSGADVSGEVCIKWPNDVVANLGESKSKKFHKLCGISMEAISGGVCVGIGVNVVEPKGGVSVAGKNIPAYVANLGLLPSDASENEIRAGITTLADAILEELDPFYSRWQEDGFGALCEEYNKYAALTDRPVTIATQQGNILQQGVVGEVDKQGRLLVRTPDGEVHPMSSGEAHLI